jgi:hypothetical protein
MIILGTSKEANLDFSIKRIIISNPINEFIPDIPISLTLLPFGLRTIFSMSKIYTNNKWSFENDSSLCLNFSQSIVEVPDKPYLKMSNSSLSNFNECILDHTTNQKSSHMITEQRPDFMKLGDNINYQVAIPYNKQGTIIHN